MKKTLCIGAIIALSVVSGCGSDRFGMSGDACNTSSQCAEGEFCSADGRCAKGVSEVVVEVTADSRSGHHAQDFALSSLSASQDIEISAPISINGEVTRRLPPPSPVNGFRTYPGSAIIRASGESTLIPGVFRQYEAAFDTLSPGVFSLFVGYGNFTVGVTTGDETIPPVFVEGVTVTSSTNAYVNLSLPAQNEPFVVAGKLLKTSGSGTESGVPLGTNKMQLQAFHPLSRMPLSQPAPIAADGSGTFSLYLTPMAAQLTELLIIARPSEAPSTMPSKSFLLRAPFNAPLKLEMGDFGSLQRVSGVLKTPDGAPVAGASIFIEGQLPGGSTYRSTVALSDLSGTFKLDAYPTPQSQYTLTALAPAGKAGPDVFEAGHLRQAVRVVPRSNATGHILEPSELECPYRVLHQGWLFLSDGSPAESVSVVATPIDSTEIGTNVDFKAETDALGRFWLNLDPGEYRFSYTPADDSLPMQSKSVLIFPFFGGERPETALPLEPVVLEAGQRVSGRVAIKDASGTRRNAPFAALRFFRVAVDLGADETKLLGQTVSDEHGNYHLVLPTP